MKLNQYLTIFFTELERLVNGHGTRHAISTNRSGALEVRLGNGDWYRAAQIVLDEDPLRAAQDVADAETYMPTEI